jgi:hypothetical protein
LIHFGGKINISPGATFETTRQRPLLLPIRIYQNQWFHDVSPTEMGNYAAEMNQLLNFREIAVRNNSGTLAAQMCKALPFHDARSSNKTWQWKIHH